MKLAAGKAPSPPGVFKTKLQVAHDHLEDGVAYQKGHCVGHSFCHKFSTYGSKFG